MKKPVIIFSGLSAISVAVASSLVENDQQLLGYCFGLVLFGVNLGILAFLARRLLSGPTGTESKATPFSNSLFIGVMPLKFVLIGIGTYLALVRLSLSPWFFVGGAASALAFAAVAFSLKSPSHFKVLPSS